MLASKHKSKNAQKKGDYRRTKSYSLLPSITGCIKHISDVYNVSESLIAERALADYIQKYKKDGGKINATQ